MAGVIEGGAWALCGLAAVGLTMLGLGGRRLAQLVRVQPAPAETLPPVTVVVAARNEADTVEPALRSLGAQDYPGLRIVIVNDRSEDATGAILDRLAAELPRLTVVHVELLPDGWLGKNHALHVGAAAAAPETEWLLFADADVLLEPSALARAITYAREARFDHVAVAPSVIMRSLPLEACIGTFAYFFSIYMRPWAAPRRHDPAFVGIGAFNLVRRAPYVEAGGHAPVRLRPDDDVMLGKWLKRNGVRQAMAVGGALVRVEWYPSVAALIEGLMKNMFAGFRYSVTLSLLAVAGLIVMNIAPVVLLPLLEGPAQYAMAGAAACAMAGAALATAQSGGRAWLGLLLPVTALLFCYIIVRAMVRTLMRGGIEWRGTAYPLAALRSNRV